ncbi:glycosyl hydrolase [Aspergillus pseudoustus]|uniref:Glycosyl hydrolase n=1 Tax=Aspergillus pseudoustus TaxID=1810923 RepID=A0ABR4JUT0_9EURO
MSSTTALQIFPGATWTSSDGRHIQAHGGGIIKVGSVFYWHGEDKTHGTGFRNINCYSSTDLVQWHYEGTSLTQQQSGDLGPDRIVERPKVVYNKHSDKYVMYLHIDVFDYHEGKVGLATCDTVNGNYEYHGSFHPLGYESRDMGVFIDDDYKGYLLCEDRPNGIHIFELSDDYLSIVKQVHLFPEHLESPAMIKRDGLYYLFASGLTFWFANDNLYTTSTSLAGPWAEWRMFAKPASATYSSQVTFVLPIGSSALYMGDRWQYPGLPCSTYVWLPLKFDGVDVKMDNAQSFALDISTGESIIPASPRLYKPHSSAAQEAAASDIIASFVFDTSEDADATTVGLQYTIAGEDEKVALVSMDDSEANQLVAFLGNASPQKQAISAFHWREALAKGKHCLRVVGVGDRSDGLEVKGAVIPGA